MKYINQIYTAFFKALDENYAPSVTSIVLFCCGAAPLSKLVLLMSPRGHSCNQSLMAVYICILIYQLKSEKSH